MAFNVSSYDSSFINILNSRSIVVLMIEYDYNLQIGIQYVAGWGAQHGSQLVMTGEKG